MKKGNGFAGGNGGTSLDPVVPADGRVNFEVLFGFYGDNTTHREDDVVSGWESRNLVAKRNRSLSEIFLRKVYGISWLVIFVILFVMKTVSVGRRKFSANFQLMFRLIKGLIFMTFVGIIITLIALPHMTVQDILVCILAFMPTGWGMLLIAQALKPVVHRAGFWGSIRTLARGFEIVMGLLLFTPVAFLAWFPFVSEFQTRMLFNQAFSRGLQISRILGGQKKDRASRNKE
uniref:1,3-beta-glucan synthase n=1 Tax=Cannabis sativa TaxID=3483 RepID=A0A803PX52_CANSA